MKNPLFLLLLSLVISTSIQAQKTYFAYFQSENGIPFQLRLNEKVHHSSSAGYAIVSGLREGEYTIGIRFDAQPDVTFNFNITHTDRGFLIKNFQSGTGLFDLQSLQVYMPVFKEEAPKEAITRTDAFSNQLARAANDSSLLTVPVSTPVAKKDKPKKEETSTAIVKEATTTTAKSDVAIIEPVTVANEIPSSTADITIAPSDRSQDVGSDIITEEVGFIRSTIIRRSESSTTEGFGLIYVDNNNRSSDTIRLLIPNPKYSIAVTSDDATANKSPNENTVIPKQEDVAITYKKDLDKKDEAVEEKKIYKIAENNEPEEEGFIDRAALSSGKTNNSTLSPLKRTTSCASVANEKDFLKLRKNMAAKTFEDDMLAEAKKAFRSKCYTTEQIKLLSTLFLTNMGKYQFFDAAFLNVSDPDAYTSLEAELKDEYYIKRFKALLGE